ncbi:MAG: 23S rRNA (adenosine(1067)-2'-O)-methyltransferase [Chlamydiae bacterium]|nr:23S rRNA (adenosine(1067)-2'-O)-methyltransferase [Chlamydiota bacterium]
MIEKKISIKSLQNPLVKHLIRLRKSRKYREENHSALLTERKIIQEVASSTRPKTVLATHEELLIPADHAYLVSEEILKKITALPAPEGVVAEFPLPKPASLKGKQWILALDQLSDPGNLGTLLRTALALGWEGVFLLPTCVDPFNEKALRASRGTVFRLPMRQGTWEELQTLSQENQLSPYVADIEGEKIENSPQEKKVVLLLSNEAHGLSPEAKKWGKRVTIPMPGEMESLNVAVAGGILMHQLRPIHA